MSGAGQPWMKFYPADWRADPALRVCSIGARGLWMEMICLMHEAEPRRSLLVAGKQVSETQLISLVGLPRKVVATLLAELEEAQVFSRDEDGTIYSRRMRRDIDKAEKDKANGKAGGNPNLKRGDNPPDKAQKPEARSQRSSLREDARAAREAFDRKFWTRYPNKVGRPAALKVFEKLWREMEGAIEPILDGLDRYIRDKPADRQWLNPTTFLNQRRFEDQPATSSTSAASASPNSEPKIDFGGGAIWLESNVLHAVRRCRKDPTTWPVDRIGPPPGSPGCKVPDRLLEAA